MRWLACLLLLGGVFAWQHQGEISLAWERSRPDYRPPAVTLLATSWCGYCRKMRQYFAQEGIAYTELDIETSQEGLARYEALEADGIPVVLVGRQVIHGFDPGGVSAALASQ